MGSPEQYGQSRCTPSKHSQATLAACHSLKPLSMAKAFLLRSDRAEAACSAAAAASPAACQPPELREWQHLHSPEEPSCGP